ncbi:helix-turn-helix domain-containing protein [Candidatus Micrarchaeota archaeon]|jgi:hypothetical protein|nr:helix-turn-helix domain-containing protein [Candidatus Micrarchaeota archaeon]
MPRKKVIELKKMKKDLEVEKLKRIKPAKIKKERKDREKELYLNVATVVKTAQDLQKQRRAEKRKLKGLGLYTLEEAFDKVKKSGVEISFRAFGGRIERKSLYSVKVGRKRYIPSLVLQDWVQLYNKFYTVRQAYTTLKKHENINFRAFIGRVEKRSIPSVKIGTQRWIPRDAIDSLTHVADNYYDVAGSIKELSKNGLKIKRNAFERRLDRGRIPHEKIGGRRFIRKETLSELIEKESARRKR